MWAFTGTMQLLTIGVSAAGAAGGAAVRHHQRNRTLNHGASKRPTVADIREHREAMRAGGASSSMGTDTVTVKSHDRDGAGVKTYTRAAPGKGGST